MINAHIQRLKELLNQKIMNLIFNVDLIAISDEFEYKLRLTCEIEVSGRMLNQLKIDIKNNDNITQALRSRNKKSYIWS